RAVAGDRSGDKVKEAAGRTRSSARAATTGVKAAIATRLLARGAGRAEGAIDRAIESEAEAMEARGADGLSAPPATGTGPHRTGPVYTSASPEAGMARNPP